MNSYFSKVMQSFLSLTHYTFNIWYIDKKSITNQANMEFGFPNELLCTFAPSEDALMSSIKESSNKESSTARV